MPAKYRQQYLCRPALYLHFQNLPSPEGRRKTGSNQEAAQRPGKGHVTGLTCDRQGCHRIGESVACVCQVLRDERAAFALCEVRRIVGPE